MLGSELFSMSATTETPRPDDGVLNADEVSASSYADDAQADNGLDILASAIHGYPNAVPQLQDEDAIFAVDFCGDYHNPVIIGRGPSAHVDLGAEERRISKKHVVVEYAPDLQLFQLQCLGVNNCRVNGHVETRRCPPTILENGDVIEIDGKLLRFQLPPDIAPLPRFAPKRASAESYEEISVKRRKFIAQQIADSLAAAAPEPKEEEILNPEDLVRPNLSWASLIAAAFQASGKQYLLVAQIYEQIARAHAFFRVQKNNNWKNAVRHALSVHSCFYRVNENEYKGGFWGFRAPDKTRDMSPETAQDAYKKHLELFKGSFSPAATKPENGEEGSGAGLADATAAPSTNETAVEMGDASAELLPQAEGEEVVTDA